MKTIGKQTAEHTAKIVKGRTRGRDAQLAKQNGISLPGDNLLVFMTANNTKMRKLTSATGLKPRDINNIIHGITEIDENIAKRLEKATRIISQSWLQQELDYQIALEDLKKKGIKPSLSKTPVVNPTSEEPLSVYGAKLISFKKLNESYVHTKIHKMNYEDGIEYMMNATGAGRNLILNFIESKGTYNTIENEDDIVLNAKHDNEELPKDLKWHNPTITKEEDDLLAAVEQDTQRYADRHKLKEDKQSFVEKSEEEARQQFKETKAKYVDPVIAFFEAERKRKIEKKVAKIQKQIRKLVSKSSKLLLKL